MSQGPTTRPTVSPSPTHLAGVPGAGLRDVTLVHSLPAGHATWLVLPGAQTQLIRNGTGPHWIHIWALAPPSPPDAPTPAPCSPCSRAHRCTWRRGSGCTSCSSFPRSWHTPAGQESRPSAPGQCRQPPERGEQPPTPLTASEPQSHSSPASTKPLPHSGGSRSCRDPGGDMTQTQESFWGPLSRLLP